MNTRLYRSPDDRVLAGVAGGMAESYGLDPALVRVGWALLILFTGGVFLILYIIMALVVPLRPSAMPLWSAGMPSDGSNWEGQAPGGPVPPGPESPFGAPDAPSQPPPHPYAYGRPRGHGNATGAVVIGVILVLVGFFFLFRQFIPTIDFGLIWPVVVIIAGAVLVIAAFNRSGGEQA
jgi:phage shock protein C